MNFSELYGRYAGVNERYMDFHQLTGQLHSFRVATKPGLAPYSHALPVTQR